MADEPCSSGRPEVEEQSADENVSLVDTVEDPLLEWVGAEPRGIASVYSRCSRRAYTILEAGHNQPSF